MAGPFERDPQERPRRSLADPTRDIRLPPLPGRPGPELPSEWERLRSEREAAAAAAPDTAAAHPDAPDADAPDADAPDADAPDADAADMAAPEGAVPVGASAAVLADQPTDQLGRPPQGPRDETLTFRGTAAERWAAGHPATPDPAWSSVPAGPAPVVAPRRRPEDRSRRWPWVLLTLVPILVIVVTGVWLLLLMRGS